MKKIGLLALAIVLSLGLVGAGFAYWTETLNISGTADTGELDAIFRQAISNDDGSVGPRFCINGYWMEVPPGVDVGDTGADPEACQTMMGVVGRIGQNIATTTVSGAHPQGAENTFTIGDTSKYQKLTVTITEAYPSYYATIFFNILNAGTIPCKVKSIKLVEVSVGSDKETVDQELVVCTTYYVDADTGNVDTTLDAVDDFSIHLSDDEGTLYDVMGTPFQFIDTAAGDLCIHVEEGAEELTTYDFVIELEVVAFNK